MMNSCCKNCENRHFKCHSDCEKYIKAKKEWTEYKDKETAERQKISGYIKSMRTIMPNHYEKRMYIEKNKND